MLQLMLNRMQDKLIDSLVILIGSLLVFFRWLFNTVKAIPRFLVNLTYISIFNSRSKYKLGDYFFTDSGEVLTVVSKKVCYSEHYNDFVAYYQLDNFENRWYDDWDLGDYAYGGSL